MTVATIFRTVVLAATLGTASVASAITYDAVAGFSASNPSGPWSYGTGTTGVNFTAMPTYSAVCEGDANLSCWQGAVLQDRVPAIVKNVTGATVTAFGTVVMPTDVLNVHPGVSTDAILRFTVPTTGIYRLKGFFELLDTSPSGVTYIFSYNFLPLGSNTLTAPAAVFPATVGPAVPFASGNLYLSAGGTFDFGINKNGSHLNDSTGVSVTFTTVPEPMTWTLMVGGFAMTGVAVRRRRSVALTA